MTSPFVTLLQERPRLGSARAVEAVVAASWILLRVVVFHDVYLPLTYLIPLLVCVWSLDLAGLWIMGAVFGVAAWLEFFFVLPQGALAATNLAAFVATLLNIVIGATAIHLIIRLRKGLREANAVLARQVEQLREQDHEIRAQADELAGQNEELTQQSEELSRRSEELGQQAEELAQVNEALSSHNEELQEQSAEVTALNDALGRREALLQALLDCTRLARPEAEALEDVCTATMALFAGSGDAAVVYEAAGDLLVLRGAAGVADRLLRAATFGGGRFAELVLRENRTAALTDTALRRDLPTLQVPGQPGFRSVIASPLRSRGRANGVISVYGFQPREWTQEQFKLLEWLAAQCSQILETLRLQEQLRRQASLIDLTPDAIVVRDPNGVISQWSRGAEQIYGWSAAEAVGRTSHELLATQFPQPLEDIETVLARAGHWSGDLLHRTRDGRELIVESRWLLRRGHDGLTDEVLEANVDVTERERSKEALRQANHVKDEFLATLSHELRTPLNAILGWSQMLHRGGLDEETTRKAIEVIARNAQVQNRLIEDVLDVSRIVSGKLRLDAERTSVVPLVESAIESVLLAAEAKGIALHREIAPGVPEVIGDAARLQQVFWNLLSNAVKFTPAGGRVDVSVRQEGSQVRVAVRDTGIGISAEFLPRVFDRFSQHDGSSSRSHTGLGLGLAIVRHLVEQHGGTVSAESAGVGQGACFSVTLPVRAVLDVAGDGEGVMPSGETAGTPSEPRLAGIRVLVVDDEPEARELVEAVLRGAGADVTQSPGAVAALECLAVDPDYDLVVTDIGMPDVDGHQLLCELRRRGLAVPAMALTAYGGPDESQRARASGFVAHLVKPVLPDTLLAQVMTLVGNGRRQ